jgi:SAM-dependent methyltransferase
MAEDWVRWHRSYDDPSTSLARRLVVVRERIAEALGLLGGRAGRILDLCAGDGRDLLPVLAVRHLAGVSPVDAVLVEQDPALAAQAQRRAEAHSVPGVRVVIGDAAIPAVYADAVPADLVLLCGIFGNISRPDIERTVESVPSLLAPGGHVIWTCGAADPDLRPAIRQLFVDTGLPELSFDGHPENFGVGLNHLATTPTTLPPRLFTFLR